MRTTSNFKTFHEGMAELTAQWSEWYVHHCTFTYSVYITTFLYREFLHVVGISFKKRNDISSYMERPDVVQDRHEYLYLLNK